MSTLFSVCSECSSNATNQSSNVVICIGMSMQLLFYIVMTGLCVKEFWHKHKNKMRFFTKKCYVLYFILVLSLVQITWLTVEMPSQMRMFDVYARQILFCCVFFYFIHKYFKTGDSKKISQRPKQKHVRFIEAVLSKNLRKRLQQYKRLICAFAATILTQLGLMISSYLTSFSDDGGTSCEALSGIWIRIGGTIIGFLFVGVGVKFYKKFSIQKKNLISLFTIEKEQGIKNFLDQEDKIEDLLSLIIVYFATQFLTLCVLVYFKLQVSSSDTEVFALPSGCSLLPPSYLQNAGVGGMAGEHALKICLNIVVIFLPQIYLFNLFKYKQPRTDYTDEIKKQLIPNEEMPNGFGRYIMFNKNSKQTSTINGRRRAARNQDSSYPNISPTYSFTSFNEP